MPRWLQLGVIAVVCAVLAAGPAWAQTTAPAPSAPAQPATSAPTTPGQTPGTPAQPAAPGQVPVAPCLPSTPAPGTGAQPQMPTQPYPSQPPTTGTPGQPAAPSQPASPGGSQQTPPASGQQAPAAPAQPTTPAQPAAPAQPATPAQPSQTAPSPTAPCPGAPGVGGTPGIPQTGSTLITIPPVPPVPIITTGTGMTLLDAVQMALAKNYTLQQSALQVAVDRASLAEAQAGFLPTVTLKSTFTEQTSNGPTVVTPVIMGTPVPITVSSGTPQSQTVGQLQLAYPLYTGNALQDQFAIAAANLNAAQAAFAAEAAQIVLQTREAYYNVQETAAQVVSAQGVVTASEENVRVTQAQVNVGTAPEFNLLQAQSQLASSEQSLAQARAAEVSAEIALATLLNVPLSTIIAPTTPLSLPAPPTDLNALIQTGLKERPEIQQAQAEIQSFQAAIDLARAGLRPNITITGGPQVTTNNPFVNDPLAWVGTITLTLTVFDGGLTAAKVQAAQEQLQEAQVSEQQTQQSVESQVRTAYLNLQQAADQLRAAQAGLVSAREQLRIAEVRLQAGVGTELDVVNALQTLAAADSAVIQGNFNYNVALAEIDQATGVQVRF